LNSELRFPLFRYFYNRPIQSEFVNNFQIVAFGDVGTAWAGNNPYAEENSLYTRVIQDGSLYITVTEQKEPLIGGFGFGARTTLFGYFLRGDLAWGVEDRKVKSPIFYFSLSLDF
jgi:outer membrane translocation and assembly module TamA